MWWIILGIVVVLIIADEWKSVGRDIERRNKLPYTPTVDPVDAEEVLNKETRTVEDIEDMTTEEIEQILFEEMKK